MNRQVSRPAKKRQLFDDLFNMAQIFNYAQMMAMPEHHVPLQPILISMVVPLQAADGNSKRNGIQQVKETSLLVRDGRLRDISRPVFSHTNTQTH